MAKIEKKVGRFEVETWTDGWPMCVKVRDTQNKIELHGLSTEDVSDLQYALERLQVQIGPHLAKVRRA